jgi:hypothetical protein
MNSNPHQKQEGTISDTKHLFCEKFDNKTYNTVRCVKRIHMEIVIFTWWGIKLTNKIQHSSNNIRGRLHCLR